MPQKEAATFVPVTPVRGKLANGALRYLRLAFPQEIPEGHALVILPLPVSAIQGESDQYLVDLLSAQQIVLHPEDPTCILPPLLPSLGSETIQIPFTCPCKQNQ